MKNYKIVCDLVPVLGGPGFPLFVPARLSVDVIAVGAVSFFLSFLEMVSSFVTAFFEFLIIIVLSLYEIAVRIMPVVANSLVWL